MRGGGLQLASILAAVAALPVHGSPGFFEGEGTTYTLGEPNNGNCNFMAYPDDAVTKYAALNKDQWEATMNCGRCAEVTCTDARCAGAKQSSEIVHIVDQCPGCVFGDLDLALDVFEDITGFTSDRMKIKWKFVDCPVKSNIKYCLKKGSNAFWAAIQPTNFVAGVASLKVNDKETTMVDSAYYFLLDGKSESKVDLSNIKITITAVNGQATEDTVSFASSDCVEGKSQFSAGNPASQSDSNQPDQSQEQQQASPLSAPSTEVSTPIPVLTNATDEVAGDADGGSMSKSASGSTLSASASPSPSPSPGSTVATTAPPSVQGVEQIKVEASGSSSKTSPAVIFLAAFGCFAAIVLIVLAVHVKKKKLDDKRDDRMSFASDRSNLVSMSGSFRVAETPGRGASELKVATL